MHYRLKTTLNFREFSYFIVKNMKTLKEFNLKIYKTQEKLYEYGNMSLVS